jgi:hypothetical protein
LSKAVAADLARRARKDVERRAPPGVMTCREDLPLLLNDRGLLGVGVEVGVQRGLFSEFILQQWRGRLLLSVDPWLAAPGDEYRAVGNVPQEEHDERYAEAQQRLAAFGERSVIWRKTSTEAAELLDPHSIDFVYLDARHDYESVKLDLEQWYGKVRAGGIIAGHDYLDGRLIFGVFGVKSAVDEFFGSLDLPVKSTSVDRLGPPSWYVEL